MSEMPKKPSVGDYILSHFHRLMDTVRRERVMAGDGILVKQTDSGKVVSAIRQHPPNLAPWYGRQMDATTIRVNKGRWTRNGEHGVVALELNCGTDAYLDATVTANQYLSAVLIRANQDKEPSLIPTSVILLATAATTKASVLSTLAGGQYYGGHVVLGQMTAAGAWRQWWFGGDITDNEDMGDDDSTIPITTGVETRSISRKSYNCNQDDTLEIHGFQTADPTITSLTENDFVMVRYYSLEYPSNVYSVAYTSPAAIVNAGGGYSGNVGGNTPPAQDHHSLTGLTDCDDHNGGRTPVAGAIGKNVYLHPDGDATRNAMAAGSRIGDHLGAAAIDPDGRTLNSTWSVDSGHFAVKAGYTYIHDAHYGKSHATKIVLTDADGNAVECYLRGGILCVD